MTIANKLKYLLAAGIFLCGGQAVAATFIDGLEDVPVMEGLKQEKNDAISFGNEESRLVEAVLTSDKIRFGKVKSFYQETLPQLGWKCTENSAEKISFYREGEVLEIIRESAFPLRVYVTVKSKN